jgi:hypothetical protein
MIYKHSSHYILFYKQGIEDPGILYVINRHSDGIVWMMEATPGGYPFKTTRFTNFIGVNKINGNPVELSIHWLYNLYDKIKEFQKISFLR